MIRSASLSAALMAALACACASSGGDGGEGRAAEAGLTPPAAAEATATGSGPAARTSAATPATAGLPDQPAAAATPEPAPEPVPVSFLVNPDGTAPRPFTAEQIAANFPVGSWNHYRIETAGQPTLQQRSEVMAWSPERVTMHQQVLDDAGQHLGPAQPMNAAWTDLREHAAFPAEATTLELVPLTLECGRFDCQRYTVRGEQGGVPTVSTFWFATSKPGPPVLYTVDTAGQRSMTMTLLDWGPR